MSFRGHGARRTMLCGLVATSLVGGVIAPAFAGDDEDYGLDKSWSDRLGDTVKDSMTSASKAIGLSKPAAPPVPESPSGCPTIAVLDGTQAQRVMAPGATGNEGLKYQYSVYNVGRECSMAGGRMSVKVGADGRVLLGPVGAAGHFDVPIRVVIFDEAQQRPVESKLYRVSASIAGGQSSTAFQFVSDNITVPIAAGRSGIDYSIKVGIDGVKGGDAGTAKVSKHHRQKATESASK